ncbi:MAG: ATP-binding protein [Candidatus Aenigmatarchaeota archaeon]
MRETIERYILNKKEEIKNIAVKERLISTPLSKEFISCIIGPRRAGKTYFLYDMILNKLKLNNEDYLFINFEEDEVKNIERRLISDIIHIHNELYGKYPTYIFLDEIHALERWTNIVYSLYEKKKFKIFVTGSSSKLLSKEIATQLRGRSLTTRVFPFNFKEILSICNFDIKKDVFSSYENSTIKNILRKFLQMGGFPQIWLENIDEKLFFKEYIDLVIFKDLVERFRIKNLSAIKTIISLVISSFSKEFSIHKCYNTFKSMGIKVSKNSLYSYISMLQDVMFCFTLKKFDHSEKGILISIPKIYLCDCGIPNFSLLSKFDENIGKLMEQAVFLELYRNQNIDIFYFKDYQQNEVDFVLKEGLKIKQLIQATYASARDEIEKREIKALLKASKELRCKDLLIITWDYEGEIKVDRKSINCIPLWKWLLSF